ncbi:MAG: GNAT family N-acetyltransferase [Burkholderiaceae bacterium]|nr:GNAT family N-acetyltransferase [Burkholderiaceae bacterium]
MNPGLRFPIVTGAEAVALARQVAIGCFQHPAWVRAVQAVRGRVHEPVVVRACDESGCRAWLPGAVHRRFGLEVFEAMPMGGYGGWVAESALSAEGELQLTRAWLARARWPLVVLTGVPGRPDRLPAPSPVATGRWAARLQPLAFETHLLDLSGGDNELLQRVRPRMRGYLRKFDQLGFEFDIANDHAALRDCHRWYRAGSHSWHKAAASLMPEGFFTALAGEPVAEVWTVRWQGRPVGAALFLVGRDELQYQASGTERIDAPVSAMEALLWQAARHHRDLGRSRLNLGASEGLDSVARFKEKFGARAVSYLRVSYLLPAWRVCGEGPARAPAATGLPS